MKRLIFLAMAISMALMIGCGDDSSGSPTGVQLSQESVKAFFPTGYKTEDVVAWYASDVETTSDGGITETEVEAVYLFKDDSFIATESCLKVKSSNNAKTFSNEVATVGTWSGSMDDFANGSFMITFNIDGMEATLPVEVTNGSMTISPEGDSSVTFKLQSSTVPTPTEAGEIVEKGDASTKSSKTNDSDNDNEDHYGSDSCRVVTSDNSVKVITSIAGYTTAAVYTLMDDGCRITAEGFGAEDFEPVDVPPPVTMDELIQLGNEICDQFREIKPIPRN